MRWIVRLLFLAILFYAVLPYYSLYRLNHALIVDDTVRIERYIDLDQVRANYKRTFQIGEQGSAEGMMGRMFRGTANKMSALTVDQLVSLAWVRQELVDAGRGEVGTSMFDRLDHAFFESPNEFLVRIGTLEEDPTHLILVREGLVWRLTAIYH